MRKINLQLFAAETNLTTTADLEPAISIDHTSKIKANIDTLREILGITEMQPMAAGTQIKIYKMSKENAPEQVGEGEVIPLTKVTRKLANTIELTADETGLVGMKHYVANDTATHGTLVLSGVKFYPERLDGIVISTISEE